MRKAFWLSRTPLQVEGPIQGLTPQMRHSSSDAPDFGPCTSLMQAGVWRRTCVDSKEDFFLWQKFFPLHRLTRQKAMPRLLADSLDGIFADLIFDHAFQNRFNVGGDTMPPCDTCHQNNVPLRVQQACSTTPSARAGINFAPHRNQMRQASHVW